MRAKVSLFCALSGLIGALVLRSSFSDTASELAETTSNPSSIKLEETHTAKIMAAPAAPAVQDKPLKVLVLEPESKKVSFDRISENRVSSVVDHTFASYCGTLL